MVERTKIPGSADCGHWEALLAEAVDGLGKLDDPAEEAAFAAHRAVCPACTALFEDSRRGREWLEFLSSEPEVPAGLLDKILAQTGPGQIEGYGLLASGHSVLPILPVRRPSGLMGLVAAQARRFAEPRLLMTAAMAFFTIALTLNLTGVRLNRLNLASLRPVAVRSYMERRLTMASTPIIRYYDHSHFVYQVESAMRQLRRTTEGTFAPQDEENQQQGPKEAAPGESKQNPDRNQGGSGIDLPEESADLPRNDSSDYLATSFTRQVQPAHSGGSSAAVPERSTPWTASNTAA